MPEIALLKVLFILTLLVRCFIFLHNYFITIANYHTVRRSHSDWIEPCFQTDTP